MTIRPPSGQAAQWAPAVQLDLDTASGPAFIETQQKFAEWAAQQSPLGPLTLRSGWHDITPQLAEELLRRNNSNRKVSFTTVLKYAAAMLRDDWQETGQPVLINQDGRTEDGQHRNWAGYLSGQTFRSYVVTDVPVRDRIFAYIDNSKPRTLADAIYTAGNNGLSPMLAAAALLAWRYDHNALGVIKQPKVRDMTNIEALDFINANPSLGETAHVMAGTYARAIKVIGNKGVAAFAGWKIAQSHGAETLDDFLTPLGSGANLEEDSVILALRNRLMGFEDDDAALKPPHRLALVIKAFNIFIAGGKISKRGLHIRDNEKYPRFEQPQLAAVA